MTLREYYGFPSDVNVGFNFTSFYDMQDETFPCPDMKAAFKYQGRTCVKVFNTSNSKSMEEMFYGCTNLVGVSCFDTSNVTNMSNMFGNCSKLTTIPEFDTSNVTNMSNMFGGCSKLTTIPEFDTSNVTNMNNMFQSCSALVKIPALNCSSISTKNYYPLYNYSDFANLTDIGGFIDAKMSWDGSNGLAKCPKLTYQSCINILNGLYDFTGNGVTPSSSQGKLKVHANFLALVGDELSIGTDKGWTITA